MSTATDTHFFDFHFHLLFKNFLKKYEAAYPSDRQLGELLSPFEIDHLLWNGIDELFLHFLNGQSSFTQIEAGKVRIGAIAIAPIEQMFSSNEGFGGSLLNDRIVTKPADTKYLDLIREGEISYYHLFLKEFQLYKLLHQQKKIRLLSRNKSNQPVGNASNNSSKLPAFVVGIEGGHTLCRTKIGKRSEPDEPYTVDSGKMDALYQDFTDNIHTPLHPDESLQNLQQALWDDGFDLCYLILTHLSHIEDQYLATHAYGMKFLKSEAKYPVGFGISALGKELVEKAYSLQVRNKLSDSGTDIVDAPVYIDIKHMSLKSRQDLYQLRREKNIKLPLIASHMGVTGYSIAAWQDALVKALRGKSKVPVVKIKAARKIAGEWGRTNKIFTFNPWTINMMDEDIIEVLESNGLIGISLDVRILGVEMQVKKLTKWISDKAAYEYLSQEEFKYYFPQTSIGGLALESFSDEEAFEESSELAESYTFPTKIERHPLALCFNILHIVAVGKTYTSIDPWQQICIGSDFDGMIDPMKNCRDASQFPRLAQELNKWLPIAAKAYEEEHGVSGLVDTSKLTTIINNVMQANGSAFLHRIGFM
jgi:microsomal dipeptidase-like Zn-dependent dipeptidase